MLLKGVIGDDPETEEFDGGLSLAGAAGTAEVFGAALAAAPPEDDMPATGGGLALARLLVLAWQRDCGRRTDA